MRLLPSSTPILASTALLLVATTTAQDTATILPLARHLTIEELSAILATETKKEFDWSPDDPSSDNNNNNSTDNNNDDDDDDSSELLWDAAVAHEWKTGIRGELFRDERYPYILCRTGDGLSGYKRRLALVESIRLYTRNNNTTNIDNNTNDNNSNTTAIVAEEEEELYFRTIYNSDDYYCVYGRLYSSIAASLSGPNVVVTPVLPALKYMEHSVDAIKGMKQGVDMTIEANLCPGVAVESENDNTINNENDNENDDDDDTVTESMVNAILAKLVPTTLAEKLADAISDAYYLTSDEYHADADDNATSTTLTSRAQLWKGLLTDYQRSGVCDVVYRTRLSWSFERAANAETSNSQLSVAFNNTGNSTVDQNCMLTFTLAVASHPAVCSLDLKRDVKVRNTEAQWLSQSELKDKVPFFDSGLDGTGQVVSTSDTGIDLDNCYFRDDQQAPATVSSRCSL